MVRRLEVARRPAVPRILAVASTLLVLASLDASAVTITVDAGVGVVLGDQAEVSARLFGLTAFEGFPTVVGNHDYRARVQALRPGVFRFGGVMSWFAPERFDPAWYDTPEAARQFEQSLLLGARYPYGRFLPVVREMGAESMFSFGNPPAYLALGDSGNPADSDQWAEMCAGYLSLWRKFDPGLRLVQVWNEPNASWFRDPRLKPGESGAELHIEMANKVSRALKARFPDVQVGGPVLCWPPSWPANQTGMKPWYTWDLWTVPWLQGTRGIMDFFDFHVYNVAPDDFQVQCEMVAAAAQAIQGRKLPLWITESGYDLAAEERGQTAAHWQKRVLPYERLLLQGMLPQADKVAGNLVHDLAAQAFRVLGDPEAPEPMYWLLWILRDLRGARLVAESDDPAVTTYATVEADRVTVVAFNDSGQSQEVALRAALPGGWWTGPSVRAIGQDEDGRLTRPQLKVGEFRHEPPGAVGTLELPPFATASVSFRLDHFATPARQRVSTECFGDQTLQFLQGGEAVRVTIGLPEGVQGQAALRLGLLGATGAERLQVRLNGRDLPARATALQDLPLGDLALGAANELVVRLVEPVDNPQLAVGFASLVVTTEG
jgi:hypothetical protein